MSDYVSSLQGRLESLEAAHYEVEESMNDAFIDGHDERELQKAKTAIEGVMSRTEDELDVLNANWEDVELHSERILKLLREAAEMLADAGLVNYDDEDYHLSAALDNEPTAITDTRRYIDGALDDWWEVRNAAREAMDDQASSGGYYGGY